MTTENPKAVKDQLEAIFETVAALTEKQEQSAANIAGLEKFTDSNDEKIREALATTRAEFMAECKEMRLLLYGSPNLRLIGLADRLEQAEGTIKLLEDQRKAQQTTIKTLQAIAVVTGSTLLGTLGTILAQYFQ